MAEGGIAPITDDRWREAQMGEFELNPLAPESYGPRNRALFHFCQISPDQGGKHIVEVGCGPVPVASFCTGVRLTVIEPLPYALSGYNWINCAVEDAEFEGDEVWCFNVMQHVRDPEAFIEKIKQVGVVRFFEPIDYPVSNHHPHTYTFADFKRWFGDCVKYYGSDWWEGFHDAPCAYGVWHANVR